MAAQKRLALRGGVSKSPPRKRKGWNLKTKIKGELRRLFFVSPHRADALKAAKIKGMELWVCAHCKTPHIRKQISIDHIEPVVPTHWAKENYWDWNQIIDRMFCPHEGLQVLCNDCHSRKCGIENVARGFFKEQGSLDFIPKNILDDE